MLVFDPFGILVLYLSLFFTGAFFLYVLGIMKGRTLLEWLTLSLSFGTLIVPFLFFLLGRMFNGFPRFIPEMIVLVFGTLSALVMIRDKPNLKVNKFEFVALVLTLLNVLLILYVFTKYPIFPPEDLVHDYVVHLEAVTSPSTLLYGWLTNSAYGITQITSYLYLAYGVITINGLSIVSMRLSMLVLGTFFPLLVYYCSLKIYKKEIAGLVSTACYCFITPFWYIGLLTTGLYGEYYVGLLGLLFVLLLAETFGTNKGYSIKSALIVLLVGILLLFSHITSLMFLLGGFIYFLIWGISNKTLGKRFFILFAIALAVGIASVFVFRGQILGFLASVVSPEGSFLYSPTPLANILPPFLFTLYAFVGIYAGTVVIILLILALALTTLRKNNNFLHTLPVIMFLAPLLASLVFEGSFHTAARYSFYSLVPMSLLFGSLDLYVFEPISKSLPLKPDLSKTLTMVFMALLISSFAVQSATSAAIFDGLVSRNVTVNQEYNIMNSLLWIRENTSQNALVFSVGIQWYVFSSYIDNRQFVMDTVALPNEMASNITSWLGHNNLTNSTVYVAVRTLFYFNNVYVVSLYENDSRYRLVYRNPTVEIFAYTQ